MSGGAFDYRDSALTDLQDMIAREIGYIQYGSNYTDYQYNEKIVEYMKNIVFDLERLSKVIHSLDWFISGDTGEDDFISDYENLYMEKHDGGK
jgi:hypothetical protein